MSEGYHGGCRPRYLACRIQVAAVHGPLAASCHRWRRNCDSWNRIRREPGKTWEMIGKGKSSGCNGDYSRGVSRDLCPTFTVYQRFGGSEPWSKGQHTPGRLETLVGNDDFPTLDGTLTLGPRDPAHLKARGCLVSMLLPETHGFNDLTQGTMSIDLTFRTGLQVSSPKHQMLLAVNNINEP